MIFVERLLLLAHALVVRPRLRNHHHHRVRQRPPRQDQHFKAIVEHRRIAPVGVDDRQDFFEAVAEKSRLEHRLARVHPVDVPAQGVDLAVVRQIAVGMAALPTRKRVGAEPGMDQRQRGFHRRVGKVGKVLLHLHRVQHALIDQRLVRQAGDVPIFTSGKARPANLVGGALANDEQLPLKRHIIGNLRIAPDENLPHERLGRPRRFAQRAIVPGHIAPADDVLALFGANLAENLLAFLPLMGVGGKIDYAGAVMALGGKINLALGAHLFQKGVGHLYQNPGAVPGVYFAPARAAVVKIQEDGQGLGDDFVGLPAFDIDNESHAARIMLELRIIKALFGRQPDRFHFVVLLLSISSHRFRPAILKPNNSFCHFLLNCALYAIVRLRFFCPSRPETACLDPDSAPI